MAQLNQQQTRHIYVKYTRPDSCGCGRTPLFDFERLRLWRLSDSSGRVGWERQCMGCQSAFGRPHPDAGSGNEHGSRRAESGALRPIQGDRPSGRWRL